MSELGRPSGQNIAAPLFDKCIEQLGAEVAAARAHENERGRWTSQGLFCARRRACAAESRDDGRWRRAREIIMRTHREVRDRLCHFRCHPLGREGGGWQNAASCSLLHSFPFLSPGRFRHPVVLGKSESISCLPCFRTRRRPRLTSTFRQNGERLVLRRRRFCRFAEWSFGEGPFC